MSRASAVLPPLLILLSACSDAHRDAPDAAPPSSPDAQSFRPPDAAPRPDATPQPDAALPCVEGDRNAFDPATGHCYLLFRESKNWNEARAACEAIDAHLVTISSPGEKAFLSAMMDEDARVWIGAQRGLETPFGWITGEPWQYTAWNEGEPNNNGGEDCVEILGYEEYRWNDHKCGEHHSYFCERGIDSSVE